MSDAEMRLNRYLAASGLCSRREADTLIENGQVTVNGHIAVPGEKVRSDGSDHVKVGDKVVKGQDEKVVVAYYKPVGVTCTSKDPHAGKTLTDVFKYPIRLTYAGRLDRDSEGLLLMTNDGELIDAMMKGVNGHEKEYIVRVNRTIPDASLEMMRRGMFLKELNVKTRPCRVERLGEHTFRIILTQGLNKQIRRMVKKTGNEVKKLKRVRVLTVELGAMQPGQQRRLTRDEVERLREAAGLMTTTTEEDLM